MNTKTVEKTTMGMFIFLFKNAIMINAINRY